MLEQYLTYQVTNNTCQVDELVFCELLIDVPCFLG